MKKIILFLIILGVVISLLLTFLLKDGFVLNADAQTHKCFQGDKVKDGSDDYPFTDDPPAICDLSPTTDLTPGRIDAAVNQQVLISGRLFDDYARAGARFVWLRINWGDGIDWEQKEYECEEDESELMTNFTFSHIYTSIRNTPYSIVLEALDTEPNTTTVRWWCYVSETGGGDGGGDLIIGPLDIKSPLECTTFHCVIDRIISFIFTVAVILLPILVITGGIMFLTAVGDPAKIKNAKKIILYAFIGFSIIFLSRLFIELLKQIFKVKTST